ncbi:MAG: hypothetical protein V2A76_00320, partial [Planctomycetota bacterium]
MCSKVDSRQFEEPPGTLEGVSRELLTGVYKLEGRLLLILDINRTLDDNREARKETVESAARIERPTRQTR